MAKNTSYARDTFDPRHELPPVIGAKYDEDIMPVPPVDDSPPIVIIDPVTGRLLPPGKITIVEQIIRQGTGGKEVVDIVIEVEDMPGATEYEVRVST